jgi:isocitrate lyase
MPPRSPVRRTSPIRLQNPHGYAAVKHQSFVGTGYFDEVARTIADGQISTAGLKDSTEERQF